MSENDEEEKVIRAWHVAFKSGTDFDLWGQPVEAIDEYQRLSKQLQKFSSSESTKFTDEQKRILGKIAICLDLRCKSLQQLGSAEGISLDDLKKIGATLRNLLQQRAKDFPVDVVAAQLHTQNGNGPESRLPDLENEDEKQELRERGSLLPLPVSFGGKPVLTIRIQKIGLKDSQQFIDPYITVYVKGKPVLTIRIQKIGLKDSQQFIDPYITVYVKGKPVLTIRIQKIGLKDSQQFIDPYITVYVKDNIGADLTTPQDTPIAIHKESTYVVFNNDVHIQKTLDSLPPGYAIFFEFKHYKPKKDSVSTRCWAFMESDEIREGTACLELYKKPANFKRKNLHLLTVKPLYLHVKLSINT